MDMSAVALRTRALKALSLIAAVDADILAQPSVRAAFENRLGDASPAVRDAAVDLVGKYVVLKPELAVDYYPQIALRTSVSWLVPLQINCILRADQEGYGSGCPQKGHKAVEGDLPDDANASDQGRHMLQDGGHDR